MKLHRCLPALAAGLLAACSGGPSVAVDHDPDFDFAGKRTYAWTEGVPAESELMERRIAAAVDEALRARGFTLMEEGRPDLLVATEVSKRQEVQGSGSSVSWGAYRGTGWGGVGVQSGGDMRIWEVTVGTLAINVVDAASEKLVWRATASDTVTDDPEEAAETVRIAVERAFAGFPPGVPEPPPPSG